MKSSIYTITLYSLLYPCSGFAKQLLPLNSDKTIANTVNNLLNNQEDLEDEDNMSAKSDLTSDEISEVVFLAEKQTEFEIKRVIFALGWREEFIKSGRNLEIFLKTHPNFNALLSITSILNQSEKLYELSEMYEDIGIEKDYSNTFLSYKKMKQYVSNHNSILNLMKIAIPSVVFFPFGVVSTITYRSNSFLLNIFSGKKIQIADKVDILDLTNTNASIYCKMKDYGDFWLEDYDGQKIVGSWGYTPDGDEAFASQEDPLRFLIACASQYLLEHPEHTELNPSEIIPAVGVSIYGIGLYSDYPILYYSKFVDSYGKARKLHNYFTNPSSQ